MPEDRVAAEAAWLVESGTADLAVIDPTFNTQRSSHALRVLERLTAHAYRGKLSLQCRAEWVDEDFVRALAALRDRGADITVEFGLQTILPAEQQAIRR